MNFLFLTTMMILIFSLVASTMSVSLKTTALVALNQDKHIESCYSFINAEASSKYSHTLKSSKQSDEVRKEKRKGKKFKGRSFSHSENGKLNLYPLLSKTDGDGVKELTTNTLKNLLKILYKDHFLFQQKVKNNSGFLDSFLKELSAGLQTTKSLAKIPFSSVHDREFFLMLCKGESVSSEKPLSLLDYITLQDTNNTPTICFPSLSLEMMEALFGKEITKKLLAEEEKHYFEGRAIARLTKDEVEKYLSDSQFSTHKKALRYNTISFKKIQTHTKGSKGQFITLGPPVKVKEQ